MNVEKFAVADLVSDPKNSRKHNEENLAAIVKSLGAFGQQKPIVVSHDGVVIAGNGTLESARRLGWTHIFGVRSALSGEAITAFGIADNRTAELAAWDYGQLAASLREIEGAEYDASLTGFDAGELENILGAAAWAPPAVDRPIEAFGELKGERREGCTLRITAEEWSKLTRALGTTDPGEVLEAMLRLVES